MILFTTASNAQKIRITPDQVPVEIQGNNDTLLVISMPGFIGFNKYLEKNFQEYYTGKYRIISPKEWRKGGVGSYRFTFQALEQYNFDKKEILYLIIDQKTGKTYQTMSHRYYSDLMIAYLKELDAMRKKQP